MRFSSPALAAASLLATHSVAQSANSSTPGYDSPPHSITPTIPLSNTNLTFGTHYAVLHLDLINGLVSSVANYSSGQSFIKNTATWINAVHNSTNPVPLTIFSRIYFSNSRQPELGPPNAQVPFAAASSTLGNSSDPLTQIYPAFKVNGEKGDIVVQKTRYYAGYGNELEELLASNKIDTVVIGGIRTSGVVLSTVYQLFDLNYKVYVIANNTIETAPDIGSSINTAILEGVIPKLPANVITIEQALAALKRSGPAVY